MQVQARFNHFNFNITDLERSLDFYRRALQLTPCGEINSEDGAFKIVYLRDSLGSDFRLELTWLRDHPQPYNLGECEFHLCLSVPNFDEVHAYHKEQGWICYENEAMGIYFILDPDGYWIEIVPEDGKY